MRGKPSDETFASMQTRIIPAHAGQTSSWSNPKWRKADHPRTCGANLVENGKLIMSGGSSPHMRGKPVDPITPDGGARIIPAHAGQTR